jgi:hypothetical protein
LSVLYLTKLTVRTTTEEAHAAADFIGGDLDWAARTRWEKGKRTVALTLGTEANLALTETCQRRGRGRSFLRRPRRRSIGSMVASAENVELG